jgi:glutamate dehydrogenase/leucine dehydrogenase
MKKSLDGNNNPSKKEQKDLHFWAILYNLYHYIFQGKIRVDPTGKSQFKAKETSKAWIDATKKQVTTTVKGVGDMKVTEKTVDFDGYARILDAYPTEEK